jgi:hypothetical protein
MMNTSNVDASQRDKASDEMMSNVRLKRSLTSVAPDTEIDPVPGADEFAYSAPPSLRIPAPPTLASSFSAPAAFASSQSTSFFAALASDPARPIPALQRPAAILESDEPGAEPGFAPRAQVLEAKLPLQPPSTNTANPATWASVALAHPNRPQRAALAAAPQSFAVAAAAASAPVLKIMCRHCFQRPVNCRFLPCEHFLYCDQCWGVKISLDRCPVCSAEILSCKIE